MAMSYHMEARIKQDRINRWNEAKRRADIDQKLQQEQMEKPEEKLRKQNMDRVLNADVENFYQVRKNVTQQKHFKKWNPSKKEKPKEPIPKPPPPSVQKIKRDNVFKILHPYDFH